MMTKKIALFVLTLIFTSGACSSTAPSNTGEHLSTPEPATATGALPEPGADSTLAPNPTTQTENEAEQAVSAPEGLRVVYLREGNLWSWTRTGSNVQLTGTGDMSTARLSRDGLLLAFMRGRDVWTVRMDGTDARLLVTQANAGGALYFAPNGTLLAVSTANHIEVIDLDTSISTAVVSYQAIPGGYYPEVVWLPDSTGFKTIIPPQAESGQAELLFVFTNGTVASLAKFAMILPSESWPYFSPDGGYVTYVAKLGDGRESLFLMDSSGATRPYGEPSGDVRAYGWLPDSKRFAYALEDLERAFLGNLAGAPSEITLENYQTIRWVDTEHFLAIQDGSLYLGNINGGKTLIDMGVSDFDFVD